MSSQHGVISLLKPPGMTSHDAVAHVRRVLKTKRVGHTGTLDPAAAGVLSICVGQATRLVEALQNGAKVYLAEATFGYETDTLDAVGRTVRECDSSGLSLEKLERVLPRFRGYIEQEPPLHSAIKVGGRRLYQVAREVRGDDGETSQSALPEIPSRSVEISNLQVTRFFAATPKSQARAFLRIECSGGTYIRSLVRDIGRALDNAATMSFLTRERNGLCSLPDSITPDEFESAPILIPLNEVLERLYGDATLDNSVTSALLQGRRIPCDSPSAGLPALWSNMERNVFALSVVEEGQLRPVKVFDLR